MFFDQPGFTGEGSNRAVSGKAIKHVLGVVVACGLTASCSSSSADFTTQMGFTQMVAQDTMTDSDQVDASKTSILSDSDDTGGAEQKKLAFAKPTARPEAVESVSVNPKPAPKVGQSAAAPSETTLESKDDVAKDEPAGEKKRSFFSALLGGSKDREEVNLKPEPKQNEEAESVAVTAAVPQLISPRGKSDQTSKPVINVAASAYSASALPGVRGNRELFEIVRKSGTGDDNDVDLYEEEDSYQLAYAGGLARLAPHGLLKQRDDVDTSCFKPQLVRILKTIERRYGKKVLVTSGYRSPAHNRRVRGAPKSAHMSCAAADIQVAGVTRWELANFVRSIPGRGGVGTYCHTASVHVDVGAERDWNWRCRK